MTASGIKRKISSVVFVDTRNRALKMYAASVTALEEAGIGESVPKVILRFAGELGTLHQLQTSLRYLDLGGETNLLVPLEGYRAMSSAGFVEHTAPFDSGDVCQRVLIVGMCGFPWMKRPALRAVNPFWAVLYRSEVSLRAPAAHVNSNPETARALRNGIKFAARMYPHKGFILEGQSDATKLFELSAPPHLLEGEGSGQYRPEFWGEHRTDVVSPETILLAGLYGAARGVKKDVLRALVRIRTWRNFSVWDWQRGVAGTALFGAAGSQYMEAYAATWNESELPSEKDAWAGRLTFEKVCPECGESSRLGYNLDGTHCSCSGHWEGSPEELVEVVYDATDHREWDEAAGKLESRQQAAARTGTLFKIISGTPLWMQPEEE